MAEESKLQNWLLDLLTSMSAYAVKIIASSRGGTPDVLACIDGHFVAIEVKSSAGVQSPLQKYHQERIEMEGGTYFLLSPQNKNVVAKKLHALAFKEKQRLKENIATVQVRAIESPKRGNRS